MLDPAFDARCALCSQCGRPLRPGARYCAGCGHALTLSAAPPPPVPRSPSHGCFAEHWATLKRVGWLFGLLLFSSFAAGMVSYLHASVWIDAALSATGALIVLSFAAARRCDIMPLLGRPAIGAREALRLTGVALAFVLVMNAYFDLLVRAGVPMLRLGDRYLQAGWPLWTIFLLGSVMPAVFEELAFRGVIQAGLERVVQRRDAWLIQAALFSVLHLTPIVFPSHFAMGICFGWLRLRSGSLYPGMLLHAGWNAFVLCCELYA